MVLEKDTKARITFFYFCLEINYDLCSSYLFIFLISISYCSHVYTFLSQTVKRMYFLFHWIDFESKSCYSLKNGWAVANGRILYPLCLSLIAFH